MTTVTPVKHTLEPVKRILRTVLALAIAGASVLPYIIGQTHFTDATLTTILGQIAAVSLAVTAFAASPAGNYVFGLIGLDATKVAKLTADVNTTAVDATPAAHAVAAVVEAPSVESVIAAADTVTAAIPPVQADAQTVAADVAAVSSNV
jgi:hypothetical protein